MTDLRVGDTGTRIEVDVTDQDGVELDLTGATDVLFAYAPAAGGTTGSGAGAVEDDVLVYETTGTDFDEPGVWKAQFTFTLGGGRYSVDAFRLRVGEKLVYPEP